MTFRITGTLTTLSPLTIGAPGAAKVGLDGKYSPSGFPLTKISRLSVPLVEAGEDARAADDVPVIPANTLRGLLRRAGASLIEASLVARGELLSLAAYNSLRSGSAFGNPDKAEPGIDEVQDAMATPPLGVFGGGPRMIPGSLRVDTGFPCTLEMQQRGIIAGHHALVEGRKLVSILWRKRTDDAGSFVDVTGAGKVVRDYASAIDAWQTLMSGATPEGDDDEDAGEADKGGSKLRGIASLTAFECVNPGVPFAFGLDLHSDYAPNLGYLLLALETFVRQQKIGGNWRLGFGRFAVDAVLEDDAGHRAPVFAGTADAPTLNTADPVIRDAVMAARAWLNCTTADTLEALFAYSDKAKADHRTKIGAKNTERQASYTVLVGE